MVVVVVAAAVAVVVRTITCDPRRQGTSGALMVAGPVLICSGSGVSMFPRYGWQQMLTQLLPCCC